jgi:hypothetical protein
MRGTQRHVRIDLFARLGNPTGGGIHAKLYLVRVGGVKRGQR